MIDMAAKDNINGKPVEILRKLYSETTGSREVEIQKLPQGGSDRIYYRLTAPGGAGSMIGCHNPDSAENRCFIRLARIFGENGVRVPSIIATTPDNREFLQGDLGDASLFSILGTQEGERMAREAIKALPKMQLTDPKEWSEACVAKPFSRRQVFWDLNYFKYEYLKPSGTVFSEERLEDDFETLADTLLLIPQSRQGFMFRDFQSRNVMIKDGEPWMIDFQGGRKGPALYDAVSFLWQAKAGFTPEFRKELMQDYAAEFCRRRPEITPDQLLSDLPAILLFRTLQVLGAYGLRGLVEQRAHFLESIPKALENLKTQCGTEFMERMPELRRICLEITQDPRFTEKTNRKEEGLTVTVWSFSYKKGYPKDFSGNGGGFMFDCRGIHNPGRYEEYKRLTGKDAPVQEFLESRGEVQPFLENARDLLRKSVNVYLRRGFSSLHAGFGCTGGQHRSVYCAEKTAEWLRKEFPEVIVRLIHREQQ